MRLTSIAITALLLLPVAPLTAQAAEASAAQVRVTAVVRDASGHLSFRHERSTDAPRLLGRWRHQAGVVAVGVDHRVRVAGTPDPLRAQQWGLDALHADAVGSAAGQVVGVVDTGVDATHPDLTGVVLPGADIVAGTGDGRIDPNGHGTHVAGVIAAVADNGVGGAGLAQGAKVLPVRVMAADGTGWDSDAAKGVVWAADHGATVVNLSFGGPDRSSVMDSAVAYALSKGVSVVVSSGNEGTSTPEWPAADPGVIAVGAINASGVRAPWSSTGSHLALTAPGVDVLSTVPTVADASGYATWSGTSMAAPFVSAAVALVRAAQPGLTVAAVRQRLMETADDLGAPGFDPEYGAGRVDIVAAEAATGPLAVTAVPPVLTARSSASRSTLRYGATVTLAGRVLSDGIGTPGIPMRLERQVGTAWVLTRSGPSGPGGLTSWVVRPDRTYVYRVAGAGWASPTVRVAVTRP